MTTEDHLKRLLYRGFSVQLRDPNLNRNFDGRFMVILPDPDEYKPGETVTEDASNGPTCIVGDDLAELIRDASEAFCY